MRREERVRVVVGARDDSGVTCLQVFDVGCVTRHRHHILSRIDVPNPVPNPKKTQI